jgi:hypothetical protein
MITLNIYKEYKMFRVPDVWKIYFFVMIGIGVGYLGSFDNKNFFILGVPTLLLLKTTNFDCQSTSLKLEKQRTINLLISTVKDGIDLTRSMNSESSEIITSKAKEMIKNLIGGMDLQSLIQTGIMAFVSNRLN